MNKRGRSYMNIDIFYHIYVKTRVQASFDLYEFLDFRSWSTSKNPIFKNFRVQRARGKQNVGDREFIGMYKKRGRSERKKYIKYMLKKHKFKLVFICENSWMYVLEKTMKKNYFQNIFRFFSAIGGKN